MALSLVIISGNAFVQITGSDVYHRNFLFDVIIILIDYIIIPYRMIFRMISALSLTAAGIFIISFYVLANFGGAFMSIRMYRQRRNEYVALENERRCASRWR